ncbi:MAG: OmpA family protein [Gammaproteobacteria bacterium]|nr:OmpA family protein [Gammaproteobacteria bacterium]
MVLDSQPTANVTIPINSNDTSEGTVSTASLIFTSVNWNIPQTVIVTGVDDVAVDGNITYNVIVGDPSSTDLAYNALTDVNTNDVSVTNNDNDSVGISVSAISGDTNESGSTATFTVVLNSEPLADVNIPIISLDTSEGSVSTALLTFTSANWNSAQSVTVTGVNDDVADGDITYTVQVGDPASADAVYDVLNDASTPDVSVTNIDNDSVGVTVSAISGNTAETASTATFTVVLNSEPSNDVTIPITSLDTSEGTVSTASLVFTNGNWNTAQTVTVTGVDDLIDDGDVIFTVEVGDPSSVDGLYNALTNVNTNDVSITNTDNDTVGVSVSVISGNTNESGTTATFTVVLDSEPTANVIIPIISLDTSEGTVSSASLTFTSGNWNAPQTITVTGVDDVNVDGNITYSIQVGDPSSVDAKYDLLIDTDTADVSLTNIDNDVPGVTVSTISGSTAETASTATFTVKLNTAPTANVSIPISSGDSTEGSVSTATLTFTNLNWNINQTVTVTGVDDSIDDGDITYTVVVGDPSSADAAYNALGDVDTSDVSVTNTDDDTAGVTVSLISGNTAETASTATFTVVLDTEPTANVTIPIISGDTSEGTVSAASLIFTSANWNTPQTITVTGVNDDVDDGDIAYSVSVGDPASSDTVYDALNDTNTADVAVTNTDDDTVGVTTSLISGTTNESGNTATFTVALNSEPTNDVVIPISTGDATEGSVSPASLTFTAANWDSAQTVTVTGVNDDVDDGDITYNIVVGDPASADALYDALNDASTTDVSVTNVDDDTVGVSVSAMSGSTSEAGTTATFTVVLNSEPINDVSIPIVSTDTGEGTVTPATLTFTAANWDTPQTVTVTGIDDVTSDGDITYTITVGDPTSVDALYDALLDADTSDVSATNVDNDVPGFTISAISGTTNESATTATFTVVLNTLPTDTVTVAISSGDTSEGTVDTALLTFLVGNWNSAQTVTVTGVNDAIDDGDITYNVIVGDPVSTDSDYNNLTDTDTPDVSVTNIDDDTAGVSVSVISGTTSESATTATFTVVLDSEPTADVIIPISNGDTSEGNIDKTSLTFTSGNWNSVQTVTVTGVNDDIDDGDITYTITVGDPSSADSIYNAFVDGDTSDVSVTNIDDDTAGVSVSAISGTTNESATTATFTVVLDTQPTADVIIPIINGDTSEGSINKTSLTFTSANWNSAQTVTVTGVNDAIDDGDIAYTITIGDPSSTDLVYNALADVDTADIGVTNIDDDTLGVTVSAIGGNTSEAGASTTFTVVLNSEPTANVTIPISSSDTSEASVSAATLIFTPTDWNTPQTITVTGIDDAIDDGDVAYSIIVGDPFSGDGSYDALVDGDTADRNANNIDDDTVGVSVSSISANTTEDATTATFTVVLNSEPTADVTIPISSNDITEGTVSTANLIFTSANWNSPQTVTVTGVDDVAADGNISFSIIVGDPSSADALYNALVDGDTADVAVTNNDNDTPGASLSVISGNTSEAGGSATFTVVLDTQPSNDVVIPFSSNNTSEATIAPASLTFSNANWNTPQTITVTGVDDAIDDGDISLLIISGDPTSLDAVYDALVASDIADVGVSNTDDDVAGVTINVISNNTNESGTTGSFSVVLNSEPTGDVIIPMSSGDSSEGSVSPTTLTFTSANWNSSQTITVTGVDDLIDDGDVAYNIIVGDPSSAGDAVYNALVDADTLDPSFTNVDDDVAGVSVSAISGTTDETGVSATFTVVLNTQPTANVNIPIIVNDTSEASSSVANLIFSTVNWNSAQTVTITGVDDVIIDGNITHSITVGDPSSTGDAIYDALIDADTSDVSVTNVDNDSPGVNVVGANISTSEAGASASFTLSLTSQPANDVTIPIIVNDSSEAVVSTTSVVLTAGNWNSGVSVNVTGVDDAIDDADVIHVITVGDPSSTDANYNNLTDADTVDINVTNIDDDTAGVSASLISGDTSEDLASATFTLVLTSEPTADVSIPVTSLDLGEAIAAPASVTFTSANWNSPQIITVTGIDDAILDGPITFTVEVGDPSSADTVYNNLNNADTADVTVINIDNEEGPAVSSAIAEINPAVVDIGKTANNMTHDILIVVNPATFDTGVDRVSIVVPAVFSNVVVTDVLVNSSSVAYTDNTLGNTISVDLTTKLSTNSRITVKFNMDAPPTLSTETFTTTVDDSSTTGIAAVASSTGDADSVTTNNNNQDVEIIVPDLDLDGSAISISPKVILADGATQANINVRVREANGTAYGNRTILIESSRGATDTLVQGPQTDVNGDTTGQVSSNTIGAATFTARIMPENLLLPVSDTAYFTQGEILILNKIANRSKVMVGESLRFKIIIRNTETDTANSVLLYDSLPRGFKYVPGSTHLNNQVMADPSGGRQLVFNLGTVPGLVDTNANNYADKGELGYQELSYSISISADAKPGEYTNQVIARDCAICDISNTAKARVDIISDPVLEYGTLLGKVFHDDNRNGVQDKGERGVADAVVVLDTGAQVIADPNGLFHFSAIDPGPHLVKINLMEMAEGSFLTTEESHVVNISAGSLATVNFGVIQDDVLNQKIRIGKPAVEGLIIEPITDSNQISVVGSIRTFELIVNSKKIKLPTADVELSNRDLDHTFEQKDGKLTESLSFNIETESDSPIKHWALIINRQSDNEMIRRIQGEGKPPQLVKWNGVGDNNLSIDASESYTYQIEVSFENGHRVLSGKRLFGLNEQISYLDRLREGSFKAKTAELTNKAKQRLAKVATALSQYPEQRYVIDGFAIAENKEASRNLSQQRAEVVRNILVNEHGLKLEQFKLNFYGEAEKHKRSSNRFIGADVTPEKRVEIEIRAQSRDNVTPIKLYDQFRRDPEVLINDEAIDVDKLGRFIANIDPTQNREFVLSIINDLGASATLDLPLPTIQILQPAERLRLAYGVKTENYQVMVDEFQLQRSAESILVNYVLQGITNPNNQMYIDSQRVEVDENGQFSQSVKLKLGENIFALVSKNAKGNFQAQNMLIHVYDRDDDEKPIIVEPKVPNLAVTLPSEESYIRSQHLTVTGLTTPGNIVYVNNDQAKVDDEGKVVVQTRLLSGKNDVVVRVVDQEGNLGEIKHQVSVNNNQLFFVGFADGKIGGLSTQGLLEGKNISDSTSYYTEGRVAFYVKGYVLGKYLVESALDTGRSSFDTMFSGLSETNTDELMKNLDPNKYYPVYGDSSVQSDDTVGQSKFYLAVKSDEADFLLGNFDLNLDQSELAVYKRRLYGVKARYMSVAQSPQGKPVTDIVIFAAKANRVHITNDIQATGGSLYFLSHGRVIANSEIVEFVVYDQVTKQPIDQLQLLKDKDYTINYELGRVIFSGPVSPTYTRHNIIDKHLADGHELRIHVDYEILDYSLVANSIGAQARQQLGKYFNIGASYVRDSLTADQYTLRGADLSIFLNPGSEIKLALADSQGRRGQIFVSNNGGLSYSEQLATIGTQQGEAYKVSAKFDIGQLFGQANRYNIAAYIQDESEQFFSNSAANHPGEQATGANILLKVGRNDTLSMRVDQNTLDSSTALSKTLSAIAQWQHRFRSLSLTAEAQRFELSGEPETATHYDIAAVRADWTVTNKLDISLEHQQTFAGDDNTQSELAAEYRLFSNLNIVARGKQSAQGFAAEAGTFLNTKRNKVYLSQQMTDHDAVNSSTTVAGVESKLSDQSKVYSEYQWSKHSEANNRATVFGVEQFWKPLEDFKLSLYGEYAQNKVGDSSGQRQIAGLKALYDNKNGFSFDHQSELRRDIGAESYVQGYTLNHAEYRFNPDFVALMNIRFSMTTDINISQKLKAFDEQSLGMAYRPLEHNDLNALARYTRLYEYDTLVADQNDQRNRESHAFSAEWSWWLTSRIEWIEKLAWKRVFHNTIGVPAATNTSLAIQHINYQVLPKILLGAEFRVLTNHSFADQNQGWLLEGSYRFNRNLRLGMGFNFTYFSDNIFSDNNYSERGWFLRVQGSL